jgi:hypothetical protein
VARLTNDPATEINKGGMMSIFNRLFFQSLSGVLRFTDELSAGKLPGEREVLRELHKILREDPLFKVQNQSFTWDSEWLDSLMKSLAQILHYPLLILLGIGVLLGLYFLIRSIAPYFQAKSFHGQSSGQLSAPEKALPPNHFVTLYRRAQEESRAGQYRQALISLHKATVEYLLTKLIIAESNRKYTNNDLKRKLAGDKTLYQPFCIIAGYAEIAGFSAIEISQADFNRALETFESAFL